MPRKTLLERALQTQHGAHVTDEGIELALAWLRGGCSLKQASAALGVNPNTAYQRLAVCLREAHKRGQLQAAA